MMPVNVMPVNGFIFDNWPTEYKYLKKDILAGKFEDVISLCIKDNMTFKDINNLFEKMFLFVMDQRFPEKTFPEKAKLSGIEQRKYRALRQKHGLSGAKKR